MSFANAKLVAFGMTKRFGRSAENDEILSEIVNLYNNDMEIFDIEI